MALTFKTSNCMVTEVLTSKYESLGKHSLFLTNLTKKNPEIP